MGDGTSSGVLTPPQSGVITKEGENFPIIQPKLLEQTPEQLQATIDHIWKSLQANADRGGVFPLYTEKEQERLEEAQVVCDFAKIAVERAREEGSLTENQNPLP